MIVQSIMKVYILVNPDLTKDGHTVESFSIDASCVVGPKIHPLFLVLENSDWVDHYFTFDGTMKRTSPIDYKYQQLEQFKKWRAIPLMTIDEVGNNEQRQIQKNNL